MENHQSRPSAARVVRTLIITITFSLYLVLPSCSDAQHNFPDKINVAKTGKSKRIKGTRLFVTAPENYTPIESMVRYQRDNNTYFQAIEIPNTNFNQYKSQLTKEAIEKKGAKVDIYKPIKYNGYDAIYFSGPSKTDGETKTGLAFGDDTFVMMLIGVYQTNDRMAREELDKILSTSFYDKSVDFDPLELAKFKFDAGITGFKYATTMGNMFIYSENGKADMQEPSSAPTFQLMTVEAGSFTKAKEFLDYVTSRYNVQGIDITNISKQDTVINGNLAYEMSIDAKDKDNKTNQVYQVVIFKDSSAVVFIGADSENGKWIDKFKATAKSISF